MTEGNGISAKVAGWFLLVATVGFILAERLLIEADDPKTEPLTVAFRIVIILAALGLIAPKSIGAFMKELAALWKGIKE